MQLPHDIYELKSFLMSIQDEYERELKAEHAYWKRGGNTRGTKKHTKEKALKHRKTTTSNLYKRIDNIKGLPEEAKRGYSWLLLNYEAVQDKIKDCKTIGEVRKVCFKEIGFAPAFIDCFIQNKSKEEYVEMLEDNHAE